MQEISSTKEIWVVGHKHSNADKSFSWVEKKDNITDADVIIIDMGTLPTAVELEEKSRSYVIKQMSDAVGHILYGGDSKKMADRINEQRNIHHNCVDRWLETLHDNIEDKIRGGGHVILLLDPEEWITEVYPDYDSIIPFEIHQYDVERKNKIHYSSKHYLKEYLRYVKAANYELDVSEMTSQAELEFQKDLMIKDNSKKYLGGEYVYHGEDYLGHLTLLPAPEASNSEQAIDKIISSFKADASDQPPSWTENIEITGMDKIVADIEGLQLQKETIDEKIVRLDSQKNNLAKYHDLLFSSGWQLEEAVKNAFRLIGFDEIRKNRGNVCEDWIIDLNSIQDVSFGLLEVKGKGAKTDMKDMAQCHKWVEDYVQMEPSVSSKGIFVSNQFRWETYPESKEQRRRFEPNELEYATKREICIIPAYVLFETVNAILKGQEITRNKIEDSIFNTNGLLKSIL